MTEQGIRCPKCGSVSYHPEDVRQKYCGRCKQFHADMTGVLGVDLSNPAALASFLSGDVSNAIAASTPGGIEEQESRGQKAFNNSDVLPIRIEGITKEELEVMGFFFGAAVDDLFQQAMLPDGWTKRGAAHAMWSYLFDDTGKQRASIFYKAAFYDRRAFMSWDR